MGAPTKSSTATFPESSPQAQVLAGGSRDERDLLEGFDVILAEVAQRDVDSKADSAEVFQVQQRFLDDFTAVCEREVRPAMEAVLERLRRNGGGGCILEHPGGEARFRYPSLVLWMSLEGEIVGDPRSDRHPYLQLEADTTAHEVHIFEGDMWRGGGKGHSGRIGTWQLPEVTRDRVIAELLAIAQRSAS